MSELSGFWTTGGATGHQQTSYTQAHWATAISIMSAALGFEGVCPGYLNELKASDGGANTVDVATGGAVADGKWYNNDAVVNVNIPSAVGAGNTRIDRIVLRVDWANYQATIHRIAGIDAATPSAPAITQTSGTTYDIMICQVLVNTSGSVTITDERDWAWVTERFDILSLIGAIPTQYLTTKDDYISHPVPDVWDGKRIVRFKAVLSTPSSSGDVDIRLYNETDGVTIATVTVTAGNTIAYTETISNPNLAEDDILRLDVTDHGTGTQGLTALVKVDKA